MKILYIANGNGINPGMSGSFVRTVEVARRLSQQGHNIFFLTTSGGYKTAVRYNLAVDYHIVPASIFRRQEKYIFDRLMAYIISTLCCFYKILKIPHVDVVYTDSDYFCDVIPALFYKLIKRARWVAIIHHFIGVRRDTLANYIITGFSHIMQRFNCLLFRIGADRVFVYPTKAGRDIKRYLINIGVQQERLVYVNNGVDYQWISSFPEENEIYEACFVGGFRPNKGIYDIVPVWKKVVFELPGAKLAILGSGANRYICEIRDMIVKEGLNDNIVLLGTLPDYKDVIKVMKKSRIFISLSYEEGWGIAITEAFSCKLPVIAYDLDVYKDIFGDCLIRVPGGDIDKFAIEIVNLLNNTSRMQILGERGYKFVERYDWDIVARNEIEIFNRLLKPY